MTFRRCFNRGALFALAATLATGAFSPAAAQPPSIPGPMAECLDECQGRRDDCVHACNAAFADCMRGPRAEMRSCHRDCAAQFEEDSPELETCDQTCREEILTPALDECRPLRKQCAPQCLPKRCMHACGPKGDGMGEIDECRTGCAGDLRECAGAGKAELRECLKPCRELTDEAERATCVSTCAEAARGGAVTCLEGFRSCSTGCDEPSPTTTLPTP